MSDDDVEYWRERARKAERLLREQGVETGADDDEEEEDSSIEDSSEDSSEKSQSDDEKDEEDDDEDPEHEEYRVALGDPFSVESVACCTACREMEYSNSQSHYVDDAVASAVFEGYDAVRVENESFYTDCRSQAWPKPCALRVLSLQQQGAYKPSSRTTSTLYFNIFARPGCDAGVQPDDEEDPRSLVSMLMCEAQRERRFEAHPEYEREQDLLDGEMCGHCEGCLDDDSLDDDRSAAAASRPILGGRSPCINHYCGDVCDVHQCPCYHF